MVPKSVPTFRGFEESCMPMYKIEVEDDRGLWTDVRADDGRVLTFDSEDAARAALMERFPVLVQMEKYAGGKRTRVIRIFDDDD